MRWCWRKEEVQESQGPRVPRSRGPMVPGFQGPRYLKLTLKYELDSKEGPSCYTHFAYSVSILCSRRCEQQTAGTEDPGHQC